MRLTCLKIEPGENTRAFLPAVNKVYRLTSIRKIAIGFFLTAASFAMIAFAQRLIDKGEVPSIAWQLWAYLLLTSAEIMISITGLEFSYTQAPKTMKSVIMAVWLFSVSLGNLFTGWVNHSIQTPGINQIASVAKDLKVQGDTQNGEWKYSVQELDLLDDAGQVKPAKGHTVRIVGVDDKAETADDVVMLFDDYGKLTAVQTSEDEVLKTAAARIDAAFMESAADDNGRILPTTQKGQELIQDLKDSLGQPLKYAQVTRNMFRIISPGADKTPATQWDLVLTGNVSRATTDTAGQTAPLDWMEKRIIELKGDEGKSEVDKARGNISATEIGTDITVGGQDTLEGAAYFDFWTYTVLITAVLFLPVGYFYKEKSYIQDASADDASEADASAKPEVTTESKNV